jgi:hypothetical protein
MPQYQNKFGLEECICHSLTPRINCLQTPRACLEVDSIGFGLSFGLQTQSSVRHMLVSTEDLIFWRPGGKVLVLGPAHRLALRVTVVCMCEGSAIKISLLWLCYFFFKKNGIQF